MSYIRSAKQVIDQAILENKIPEYMLYIFSVFLFFSGGYIYFSDENALLATVLEVTVIPAIAMTKKFRERNMALRLMEIPLSNAQTAEEAARALKEVYMTMYNSQTNIFGGKNEQQS
ncbi:hypothetical protein [Sessilibacter corallicola]|uniref:hypothetical protein n=1 Tax=Sessilibacter corallicola TaxID=2904075 RepID=UPI001E2F548F|nr:hypothetical protein [Sessilibacter corallicola]MCE2029726.1 hypothetical protein [Sessilibacter corallicola]